MRELQELLAERGFYKGTRDGTFGPVLRTAIEKFEQSEGRPETGLATTALLQRLTVMRAEIKTRRHPTSPPQIETGKVGSHRAVEGPRLAPAALALARRSWLALIAEHSLELRFLVRRERRGDCRSACIPRATRSRTSRPRPRRRE